jgi:transposase
MPKQKHPVALSAQECKELQAFVSRGKRSAREINRARILLLADEGKKDAEIIQLLGVSRATVHNVRKKYCKREHAHILDFLKEEPRSGAPIKIDSRVETNVTMIACSDPPEGSARWTLHMIADKLVELAVIDSISHESVRRALKKQTQTVALGTMVRRSNDWRLHLAYGRCALSIPTPL